MKKMRPTVIGWQTGERYGATPGAEFEDLREHRLEDARKGREAVRRYIAGRDRGDIGWKAPGRLGE